MTRALVLPALLIAAGGAVVAAAIGLVLIAQEWGMDDCPPKSDAAEVYARNLRVQRGERV